MKLEEVGGLAGGAFYQSAHAASAGGLDSENCALSCIPVICHLMKLPLVVQTATGTDRVAADFQLGGA